jgi:hypothetical protein
MNLFSPSVTMVVGPITFKATATDNVDKVVFSIGDYTFTDHAADADGVFECAFSERLFGMKTLKVTAFDFMGAEYAEEYTMRIYSFGFL